MSKIRGKTVLITGASAGIGKAITKTIAEHQPKKIILVSRRQDKLQLVADSLADKQIQFVIQPLDLSQHDQIPVTIQKLLHNYGPVHILVHNAGISQRSLTAETSLEVDKKIMDIDYFGTVALTKALLPSMLSYYNNTKTPTHTIVITSLAGKFGVPMRSAYAGAKHALHGFFDTLRAEYQHKGINVTLVCPGYIRTDISINSLDAKGNKNGQMDTNQAEGLSPELLAKRIIKALNSNKAEIYVGKKEIFAVYLKRFFPSILRKILAKRGQNQLP